MNNKNFKSSKVVVELKKRYILIILFIGFLCLITQGINLPYAGPNATNFAVYSLIAHNFNAFGYIDTKFAPVISVSETLPSQPEYFFHHPTLLSFIESLLFRLFGEYFWVGRLTVIIFAFGSLILTYLIGKTLVSKAFGVIALAVMVLIPGSTIFGKMIGQEPLVLFFGLLSLYSVLYYFFSNKKFYLFICASSIALGILSDWPMAFFIICFIPLFAKHKQIKLGILLSILSILITLILLSYVFLMRNGFWDLQNALALRSVNGLLEIPFWQIRWVATMLFRDIIYFNPIFFIFSLFYLIDLCRLYRKKQLKNIDFFILGLFLFSVIHQFVYAQAVFTHPYLIYYAMMFVVFASAIKLQELFKKKSYIKLFAITIFSIVYLLIIQIYKFEQITSNVWRYDVMKILSKNLIPYEEIAVNNFSTIDSDLLWYPFFINRKIIDENTSTEVIEKYKHYLYSCSITCSPKDERLSLLINNYQYAYVSHPQTEVYLFSLQQKNKGQPQLKIYLADSQNNSIKNINVIRDVYRYIKEILYIPQF